ncbi:Bacterial alpha-L-rhamnosidase [Bifidobacterium sp. SMB2]|uniref:alpha-L-rhamnosidase n=1 Tax=Bifidobacterium saimiriisciurei TaxID=2661627 RepID=A0ABX0CHG1_9BIFI|nr:family 78 glycoside hydrolase catalytic domain [Bifidobacterium saimiriisciurei]NEG97101.1 Bacterial alpha-L-rhamnosidase [Bifidobacterium sp. SMB2]NEH12123.1 Bacterial alpha-L-rhamnosidase [Bifidobacterium saimiriisciurei]
MNSNESNAAELDAASGAAELAGVPAHIRINDRIEPVDLAPESTVAVRWWFDAAGSAAKAADWTSYQIIVTDHPLSGNTVWDSGRCDYDGDADITLEGLAMPASTRYWLAVRVWDGEDHVSAWSRPATFGTGAGEHWQAKPIWVPADAAAPGQIDESAEFNLPEEDDVATDDSFFVGDKKAADEHNSRGWAFLRGAIDLPDKPVVWATLNVTASSTRAARQFVYRIWVNGTFVGYGPTFPIGDEARYDGYDVTGLLNAGDSNAIGALAYTVEDQRFIAQLDVCFADGETARYGTGPDWRTLPGTTIYPDSASVGTQYFEAPAENVQAANYPFGFAAAGFDDADWTPAAVRGDFEKLLPTPTDKPTVQYHAPASSRLTDDGHLILDFGRTWEGGVRITRAAGHGPADLKIRYGEVLNPDGSVKWHLSAFNNYEDTWHLGDGGTPTTMETWGLRVFRYVEVIPSVDSAEALRHLAAGVGVDGAEGDATAADSIEAAALVYPFDRSAASFTSSNATLETVWNFCRNTMESTNGNIYADSWTRERAPYEGDAWLQQHAHLAVDDAPALAEYSVDWLIANRTWPTEWPLYLILAAHDAWMRTGSIRQIAGHYDDLVTLLPTRHLDEDSGLIVKDPGESSHTDGDLIDWPPVERDGFRFGRVNTVINALSSQTFADMADIAAALGRNDDAERFAHIAHRMRAAMHERLYDAEAGAYVDGLTDGASGERIDHHSLHASAFALAFAELPESQREPVGAFLRGKGMACSVYAASVYLAGLYAAGFGADATALIAAHDGLRTWMNMIDKGAGATMEAWDVENKPNTTYSHPWAASPAYLLPEGLLGIRPTAPGYAEFEVRPQLGEPGERGAVDSAAATVPTVRGPIAVRAERVAGEASAANPSAGAVRVIVDVPDHAEATVLTPQGAVAAEHLAAGRHEILLPPAKM